MRIGRPVPNLISLNFSFDIWMAESEFGVNNKSTDSSYLVTIVLAGTGVMVWVLREHYLNSTVYLIIASGHVHPFMTTM